jgi:hypothetical protein
MLFTGWLHVIYWHVVLIYLLAIISHIFSVDVLFRIFVHVFFLTWGRGLEDPNNHIINSGRYTFCSKPLTILVLGNLAFEQRGSQIVKNTLHLTESKQLRTRVYSPLDVGVLQALPPRNESEHLISSLPGQILCQQPSPSCLGLDHLVARHRRASTADWSRASSSEVVIPPPCWCRIAEARKPLAWMSSNFPHLLLCCSAPLASLHPHSHHDRLEEEEAPTSSRAKERLTRAY